MEDHDFLQMLSNAVGDVRNRRPLIHQITNYVTVNDCANITLAIGASPIMADAIEESGQIASIASALVLNIGTLNPRTLDSMISAGKVAGSRHIPIVLDPVGAGASSLRNEAAKRILSEVHPDIVRGNLSEIAYIAGLHAAANGVDVSESDRALDAAFVAKTVAQKYGCVVAVTGATDVITDGRRMAYIKNGHPMMASLTGTGCMSTALIGAFSAAAEPFTAAVAALSVMGISGETAYRVAGERGTGSYRMALIDAVSRMTGDTLLKEVKLYA